MPLKQRWKDIAAKLSEPRASREDIAKRIGDVIESWPAILPPNEFVQVRADLLTAAYTEIEQLRAKIAEGK